MWSKVKAKSTNDFRKDIPEYSDEQLIEILKLRDYYQPEAAQLAIEEALKRGIIHSEQDLFSEEYRCEELKFSLFPVIIKKSNRNRIRKSIARSLVICGVIPLVFGILKLNDKNFLTGSIILFFALLWMIASAQLIKFYHKQLILLLVSANLLAIIYILYQLLFILSGSFMDYFIVVVLFTLILYGLVFLMRISNKK